MEPFCGHSAHSVISGNNHLRVWMRFDCFHYSTGYGANKFKLLCDDREVIAITFIFDVAERI